MVSNDDSEIDAVKKVIRRWARSFSNLDAEGVLSAWDSSYPKIMHQAEEFPDPIRGWDELVHYNRAMMSTASNIRGQSLADLEADVMGDVAWCYLRGGITFDIPGMHESLSGETRQTFILHKVDGAWKLIHYHESRETPELRQYLYNAHPRGEQLRESDEKEKAQNE